MGRTKRPSKVLREAADAAQRAADANAADAESDWRDDLRAWDAGADENGETREEKFERIGRAFCAMIGAEYDAANDPHPMEFGAATLRWKDRQVERVEAARYEPYERAGEPDASWPMDALLRYMRLHGLEVPHAQKPETWTDANFNIMPTFAAILQRDKRVGEREQIAQAHADAAADIAPQYERELRRAAGLPVEPAPRPIGKMAQRTFERIKAAYEAAPLGMTAANMAAQLGVSQMAISSAKRVEAMRCIREKIPLSPWCVSVSVEYTVRGALKEIAKMDGTPFPLEVGDNATYPLEGGAAPTIKSVGVAALSNAELLKRMAGDADAD